jgi:Tol biopolymer transport system component
MTNKTFFRIASATLTALALAASLHGCGGGGGGDGSGGGGVVDPPPPSGGPSGHLWYYNISSDKTYIGLASAGEAEKFLTNDSAPLAWPDGSQYLEYEVGNSGTDLLTIKATASGATLYQVELPTFCGFVSPSPVDKHVVLTQCYTRSSDTQWVFFVIDVASQVVLHSEAEAGRRYKHEWLPDGRYARFHDETGEISVASVGGAWQVLGKLSVPSNTRIADVSVNPQGTQVAVTFRDYLYYADEVLGSNSDLWVANLNGSGQARVTLDGNTYRAVWSPDGKYLSFDVDTSSCNGGGECQGKASAWYTAATSRNLSSVVSGVNHPQATQFQRRYADGTTALMVSSGVIGWYP